MSDKTPGRETEKPAPGVNSRTDDSIIYYTLQCEVWRDISAGGRRQAPSALPQSSLRLALLAQDRQGRLYAGTSKEMQGQTAVAYHSITLRTVFVPGKHSD